MYRQSCRSGSGQCQTGSENLALQGKTLWFWLRPHHREEELQEEHRGHPRLPRARGNHHWIQPNIDRARMIFWVDCTSKCGIVFFLFHIYSWNFFAVYQKDEQSVRKLQVIILHYISRDYIKSFWSHIFGCSRLTWFSLVRTIYTVQYSTMYRQFLSKIFVLIAMKWWIQVLYSNVLKKRGFNRKIILRDNTFLVPLINI